MYFSRVCDILLLRIFVYSFACRFDFSNNQCLSLVNLINYDRNIAPIRIRKVRCMHLKVTRIVSFALQVYINYKAISIFCLKLECVTRCSIYKLYKWLSLLKLCRKCQSSINIFTCSISRKEKQWTCSNHPQGLMSGFFNHWYWYQWNCF